MNRLRQNSYFTATATLIVALGLLMSAREARADHIEDGSFPKLVETLQAHPDEAQTEVIYDAKSFSGAVSPFSEAQLQQLASISRSQGEIWGDTILEGDYEADGKTQLDRVERLSVDGRMALYRVTYSERAWDTSQCTPKDASSSQSLEACVEGRIEESTLVSLDLMSWVRDERNFAAFVRH